METIGFTKLVNTKHKGGLSLAHGWPFDNASICAIQVEKGKTSLC